MKFPVNCAAFGIMHGFASVRARGDSFHTAPIRAPTSPYGSLMGDYPPANYPPVVVFDFGQRCFDKQFLQK